MDPPHSPYKELEDTDPVIFDRYYKDIDINKILNRPNVDIERAQAFARYHFSMVTLIDREIGRVLSTLKEKDMFENTLIVFTSDHGEMMGSHGLMAKNVVFEESLGIPLLVHYPNKLSHKVSDLLISVPDFMPSILGLLGLQEYQYGAIDGEDFSHYMRASASVRNDRKSSLYYGKSSEFGVKTHQYTYAINASGELIALFDNEQDPYQLNSLALSKIPPKHQHMLKSELGKWLQHINHQWYVEKKHPSMITYPSQVNN